MASTESVSREQIVACEKKLLDAFGNRDIDVLNELIHEDALFVLPNAQTITKATVLDNYRNGTMVMKIIPSDHNINLIGDTAVISVNLELHGKSFDKEINSQFRYLRVWKLFGGAWKIIATGGIPIGV